MSLTYPLTPPSSPTFNAMAYHPRTVVGYAASPFTGQQQTYVWPGQWWEIDGTLPPLTTDADADAWIGFLLALNGRQGTFYLGPSTRKSPRGSAAGTAAAGAANVANSTTLITKTHTGSFAVGDWLQVGATSAARLHRVVQVNSQYSYDVFPRLRSAYADGTSIVFTNPVGIFRLKDNDQAWDVNLAKHVGLQLSAVEVL